MEISETEYELLRIFAAHEGRGSEMDNFFKGFEKIKKLEGSNGLL